MSSEPFSIDEAACLLTVMLMHAAQLLHGLGLGVLRLEDAQRKGGRHLHQLVRIPGADLHRQRDPAAAGHARIQSAVLLPSV